MLETTPDASDHRAPLSSVVTLQARRRSLAPPTGGRCCARRSGSCSRRRQCTRCGCRPPARRPSSPRTLASRATRAATAICASILLGALEEMSRNLPAGNNGQLREERCAVLARVARSFLRFGSFELCLNETDGREGPSARGGGVGALAARPLEMSRDCPGLGWDDGGGARASLRVRAAAPLPPPLQPAQPHAARRRLCRRGHGV